MTRRLLVLLAVFCGLAFAATKAPAKDLDRRSDQTTNYAESVLASEQHLLQKAKTLRFSIRLVRLHPRQKAKVEKVALKRCGCMMAVEDTAGGYATCMESCMRRWGMSAMSVATCIGICTNPATLPGCAACAGVQEWIVMGCAQYCVWRKVLTNENQDPFGLNLTKNLRSKPSGKARSQVAKLKPKTAGVRI